MAKIVPTKVKNRKISMQFEFSLHTNPCSSGLGVRQGVTGAKKEKIRRRLSLVRAANRQVTELNVR
jgi:hypothetical protein